LPSIPLLSFSLLSFPSLHSLFSLLIWEQTPPHERRREREREGTGKEKHEVTTVFSDPRESTWKG
jgi:hypothetical protein